MKSIFMLSSLLLIPFVNLVSVQNVKSTSDNEIYSNVSSFFKGTYRITSTVKSNISNTTFTVIDEVSNNGKTSLIKDAKGNLLKGQYIISEGGIAKEQYLDISNNICKRDVSSTAVLFSDYFASPFEKIVSSVEDIQKYFSISKETSYITFTASEEAIAKVTNVFNSFFSFVNDTYPWDVKTVKETVKGLSFACDLEGNPTSMSFKKIKRDCYGGMVETYSSSLEKIDQITSLKGNSYNGNDDSKSKLENALNALSSNLNGYNFKQTVTTPLLGELSPYHNYYQFNEQGYGLMLCDIGFHEQSYGTTYLGMTYSDAEDGYYMIGVSPDSDYYAAASDDVEHNLFDCIPLIRNLSVDHFTYNQFSSTWTFDLENFLFNDYNFSINLLKVLFGTNDPIAFKFGYYFYDSANYIFDFNQLNISLSKDNALSFTLRFTDFNGDNQYVTTTFSDFGLVDLSTHATLKDAFNVLFN